MRPPVQTPARITAGLVVAQAQDNLGLISGGGPEISIISSSGLASLDFELPVRGSTFFFTTARGDTQITVQAISRKQLYRWQQIGRILIGLFSVCVVGWVIVRINASLNRRVTSILLILLGFVSLVTFMLPMVGLVTLIWGSVALFGRDETP